MTNMEDLYKLMGKLQVKIDNCMSQHELIVRSKINPKVFTYDEVAKELALVKTLLGIIVSKTESEVNNEN